MGLLCLFGLGTVGFELVLGDTYPQKGGYFSLTSDGGYLVSGYTNEGVEEVILVKLSYRGEVQWARKVESSVDFKPKEAIETEDGGFIQVGTC